jgi:regulator of protease activity HflC (stomatin/prohibitin superfamily)
MANSMAAIPRKPASIIADKPFRSANGFLMFFIGVVLLLAPLWGFLSPIFNMFFGNGDTSAVFRGATLTRLLSTPLLMVLGVFILKGLYTVQPNQAVVLLLFGDYKGTDRSSGLRWVNPFLSKTRVSERSKNFVTQQLKVNDKNGNPIEIAAAVVWRVSDAAQATLGVEDYAQFVNVQSESAVRHLAAEYAYDHGPDETSTSVTLRSGGDAITQTLATELSSRLQTAGIEVIDTKLTHLAYSPEIAGAMLRRQQATAVLAARKIIVEGAVGMVEMALKRLAETQVVELDADRKAAMVSNLMVVLCSDKDASPVINSGS